MFDVVLLARYYRSVSQPHCVRKFLRINLLSIVTVTRYPHPILDPSLLLVSLLINLPLFLVRAVPPNIILP